MAICVVYTAFSEWLNVVVRHSWAYSGSMPAIALGSVRIGLSPIAQWIIVPAARLLGSEANDGRSSNRAWLLNLTVVPLGLGLLGFVEPYSVGSTLLFVKAMGGKNDPTRSIAVPAEPNLVT